MPHSLETWIFMYRNFTDKSIIFSKNSYTLEISFFSRLQEDPVLADKKNMSKSKKNKKCYF